MKIIPTLALALQLLLPPILASALDCTGKTCSYLYKYQKRECRRHSFWPWKVCKFVDRPYLYCAQRWGSKPAERYGDMEIIFGDDDRIQRLSGTGKEQNCKSRETEIKNKYNQDTGATCTMDWDKKSKYAWFASRTAPCWDANARRALVGELIDDEHLDDASALDGEEPSLVAPTGLRGAV